MKSCASEVPHRKLEKQCADSIHPASCRNCWGNSPKPPPGGSGLCNLAGIHPASSSLNGRKTQSSIVTGTFHGLARDHDSVLMARCRKLGAQSRTAW